MDGFAYYKFVCVYVRVCLGAYTQTPSHYHLCSTVTPSGRVISLFLRDYLRLHAKVSDGGDFIDRR